VAARLRWDTYSAEGLAIMLFIGGRKKPASDPLTLQFLLSAVTNNQVSAY